MKFKDSFFYFSIVRPIKAWAGMSPYYMVLALPFMALVTTIALIAVIPIDGYMACKEALRLAL